MGGFSREPTLGIPHLDLHRHKPRYKRYPGHILLLACCLVAAHSCRYYLFLDGSCVDEKLPNHESLFGGDGVVDDNGNNYLTSPLQQEAEGFSLTLELRKG